MGVTLARGAIKGGKLNYPVIDMGPSLTDKVDTFIGIAGANYGLVNCEYTFTLPTCAPYLGFYPGTYGPEDLSYYLHNLNTNTIREGKNIFAMMSTWDDLISYGDLVWGKYTSDFPTTDKKKVFETYDYSHIALRDLTANEQLNLIKNKQFLTSAAQKEVFLS
jgi:triacylglycerol lipase